MPLEVEDTMSLLYIFAATPMEGKPIRDRLRQSREPAVVSGRSTAKRNRSAACDRRFPSAGDPATDDGKPCHRRDRGGDGISLHLLGYADVEPVLLSMDACFRNGVEAACLRSAADFVFWSPDSLYCGRFRNRTGLAYDATGRCVVCPGKRKQVQPIALPIGEVTGCRPGCIKSRSACRRGSFPADPSAVAASRCRLQS